ncbi:MAG: MerR family transcriptional regulator [Elusimicrobia bacterium]|nr:MerR family transcriptional regulator [Elusimicrobiota bacterium]
MSEKTYLTMREVSRAAQLPEYTIRYWEAKFRLLRPLRLSSGHRRYTRADVDTLLQIKDLVFVKGYSLDGARKALSLARRQKKAPPRTAATAPKSALLDEIARDLRQLLKEL